MNRLCKAVILFLSIGAISFLGLGATSAPAFYSAGVTYQVDGDTVSGKICTVVAESDKHGMAGIEQDIVIETSKGNLTLEVINWYYGDDIKVGYVLYGPNGFIKAERREAQLRTIYDYNVFVSHSTVYMSIFDGEGLVLSNMYPCRALRIIETSSYIEYWRYDEPGSFLYYGYVTIDNPVQYREDFYYKAKGYPFDLYLIHRTWNNVVDKGEVDDRLR